MNTSSVIRWSAVVAVASVGAVSLSGCLGKTNVWGRAGDPMPEGATRVPSIEMERILGEDSIRTITPDEFSGNIKSTDEIQQSLKNPPVLLPIRHRNGERPLIAFSSDLRTSEERQHAKEAMSAHSNRLAMYRLAYSRLSPTQKKNLPSPDSLGSEISNDVADQLDKATGEPNQAGSGATFVAVQKTDEAPGGKCVNDVGTNLKLDTKGNSNKACNTLADGGVLKHFDFPLKRHQSCVKNQGGRGTCVSFAFSGAFETLISKKSGKAYNLSEQSVYNQAKNVWFHEDFDDGLPSTKMADQLEHWHIPAEKYWDYNSSSSRDESFKNSCVGYAETCSDTAHQSRFICGDVGEWMYCGFAGQYKESKSGFRLTNHAQIWDGDHKNSSVSAMIEALGVGQPVVFSIEVTPGFRSPDDNGFITDLDPGNGKRPGHAILAIGYISNADLAAKIPTAPAAPGGGYFVIKNSWSPCYGDGGYAYMPVEYVKLYMSSAEVIADVSTEETVW